MSTPAKIQLSVAILLAASGFLLAMRWLLPGTAYGCKAVIGVAALLILFSWQKWAHHQWGQVESCDTDRKKRLRATARTMRFNLLLVAWIFAMFPSSLAAFHAFALSGQVVRWLVALLVILIVGIFTISAALERIKSKSIEDTLSQKTVEDRLDELERLKRRDMVTPEEYAAKRQQILKDL